jgi:hypothetical protein
MTMVVTVHEWSVLRSGDSGDSSGHSGDSGDST